MKKSKGHSKPKISRKTTIKSRKSPTTDDLAEGEDFDETRHTGPTK